MRTHTPRTKTLPPRSSLCHVCAQVPFRKQVSATVRTGGRAASTACGVPGVLGAPSVCSVRPRPLCATTSAPRAGACHGALRGDLRQAFQPEKWTQQYKTARTRLSAGAARLAVVGRCALGRLFGAWRSARGSWEAPQEEVREAGACAAARSKHATHCLPDANERSSCLGSGGWGWEGYRAVHDAQHARGAPRRPRQIFEPVSKICRQPRVAFPPLRLRGWARCDATRRVSPMPRHETPLAPQKARPMRPPDAEIKIDIDARARSPLSAFTRRASWRRLTPALSSATCPYLGGPVIHSVCGGVVSIAERWPVSLNFTKRHPQAGGTQGVTALLVVEGCCLVWGSHGAVY